MTSYCPGAPHNWLTFGHTPLNSRRFQANLPFKRCPHLWKHKSRFVSFLVAETSNVSKFTLTVDNNIPISQSVACPGDTRSQTIVLEMLSRNITVSAPDRLFMPTQCRVQVQINWKSLVSTLAPSLFVANRFDKVTMVSHGQDHIVEFSTEILSKLIFWFKQIFSFFLILVLANHSTHYRVNIFQKTLKYVFLSFVDFNTAQAVSLARKTKTPRVHKVNIIAADGQVTPRHEQQLSIQVLAIHYCNVCRHYSGVTWTPWRLKSPATPLCNCLFRLAPKKTSKLSITGLLWGGGIPVTDGFYSQRGRNAKAISCKKND